MALPKAGRPNYIDDAIRKRPKKVLSKMEQRLQDADIPRCPICRIPIWTGNNRRLVVAHDMQFLVHDECNMQVQLIDEDDG